MSLLEEIGRLTAERDDLWKRLNVSDALATRTTGELAATKAHSENLAWSLLIALAERDDALWTLAKVNGRAQEVEVGSALTPWTALRDIRAYCERRLRR